MYLIVIFKSIFFGILEGRLPNPKSGSCADGTTKIPTAIYNFPFRVTRMANDAVSCTYEGKTGVCQYNTGSAQCPQGSCPINQCCVVSASNPVPSSFDLKLYSVKSSGFVTAGSGGVYTLDASDDGYKVFIVKSKKPSEISNINYYLDAELINVYSSSELGGVASVDYYMIPIDLDKFEVDSAQYKLKFSIYLVGASEQEAISKEITVRKTSAATGVAEGGTCGPSTQGSPARCVEKSDCTDIDGIIKNEDISDPSKRCSGVLVCCYDR